jgi:hypothetical protein
MESRRLRAVLVGALLLASLATVGTPAAAQQADPDSDVVGWENGYWHNESIDVDQSDGLSDAELEAYVSRAMARIEVLREREFGEPVPVEVISRSEFGNRTEGNASEDFGEWNNQVWEALFVVGEDADVQDVLHSTSTAATSGGYFFVSDEITIVTDDPEDASIDRGTLVHELVHAQQDQYVDLTNETYRGRTQDEQLATDGLIEGEANYIEDRYQARCGVEWECVASPSSGGGGGGSSGINRGLLYTIFFPYSDGPPYVHSVVEEGGWAAVNEMYGAPPNSTEQVIHQTEEDPVPLRLTDNATDGWETFPEQGVNGTDTAGEASIFMMLWYQSWEYDAETIPVSTIGQTSAQYDVFNYDSVPSAGWANDAVLPYRKETTDGTQYGYVWTIEWDTETDATQFLAAYRAILSAHDARRMGPRTWVIEAGPYADDFRVAKEGRRVTIVNAPGIGDLDDIRPDIEAVEAPTTTESNPPDQPDDPIDTPASSPGSDPIPSPGQPGLGAIAAIGALGIAWLVRRRWRGR